MKSINVITKKMIFWVLILGFLTTSVNAEELTDHTFKAVLIRDALQIIAARYGVTIISDPALTGLVNGTIHGNDSVEEAIGTIVEPLGYSFTRVKNYFLVSGLKSPLTVYAETESSLVPVGFISPDLQNQLSEFSQYLTFDKTSGVVFIKAPTSLMNKILTAIWKATNTADQISILYHLQIVDLGTAADLDVLFSGSYDSAKPQEQGSHLVVSPGELGVDGQLSALIRDKITRGYDSFIRQPWVLTLPGKTVEIRESLHYLGDSSPQPDQRFTLKITPIRFDDASGKVLSEVYIGRDDGRTSRVSSTIRSNPGSYELLAMVRQTELIPSRALLGSEKIENHRDFAILLAATPINIQSALVESGGIVPIASLKGGLIGLSDPTPVTIPSKPELEMGVAISDKNPGNPWFNLTVPFNSQSRLQADYRNSNLFSLRFSSEFEPSGGTYLDFLAGKGVGTGEQVALMVGLGDRVRLTPYLSLFGVYYPNTFLLETKEYSGRIFWSAGASLDSGKFGLSVSASGNPDFNGWRVKMDLTDSKASWLIDLSTVGEEPVLFVGLGLKF